MRSRSGLFHFAFALATALCGCSLVFPISDEAASGTRPPVYRAIADRDAWSFHTLAVPELDGGVAPARLLGGVFDGTHLVLVPFGAPSNTPPSAPLHAFDTRKEFTRPDSWGTLDLVSVAPKATSFSGGCFDGRYTYLAPATENTYLRRDFTSAPLEASSWQVYESNRTPEHTSCASDGRFVYFGPRNGTIVRHDSTQAWNSEAFWESFSLGGLDATVGRSFSGYAGTVFDGRFLYLVPLGRTFLLRFDTQAPFADVASWSFLDLKRIDATVAGFEGATFDGRFIYLAPSRSDNTAGKVQSVVLRFDTQGPALDDGGSWRTFDTAGINDFARGFAGAVFDGRHVYFVPTQDTATAILARFDTERDFGDVGAWEVTDIAAFDPKARAFRGAVFDGRYVYFVPSLENVVARFDARVPPSPPKRSSSF